MVSPSDDAGSAESSTIVSSEPRTQADAGLLCAGVCANDSVDAVAIGQGEGVESVELRLVDELLGEARAFEEGEGGLAEEGDIHGGQA